MNMKLADVREEDAEDKARWRRMICHWRKKLKRKEEENEGNDTELMSHRTYSTKHSQDPPGINGVTYTWKDDAARRHMHVCSHQ